MKIKECVGAISGLGYLLAAKAASAEGTAGIAEKTADQVGSKVVEIVQGIVTPIGSAVIFVSIAITALKIITTHNKPTERAEAMSGIPYILGGGMLLGGVLLAAGFVIGIMNKAGVQ